MNHDLEFSREELHAFIDGELDPARAEELSKSITADPVLAANVAAFRSDKERVGLIFGNVRERPLPAKWLQLIEDRAIPRRRSFPAAIYSRWGIAAIAASLLLAIGVWLAHERFSVPNEDAIIAEALAARANTVHPSASLPVGSDAGRPNQVLARALSMRVQAPDLTRMGYSLSELHVYSGVPGGNAVELRYRDAQNRLFTLYLRRPTAPPRVDLVQRDGVRICIWQDDVLGAVMAGQMSAGEMARVASLAYSELML